MGAERIDDAKWVLERQLAWITATEVKVGVVVTIQVAMLGGLGAALSAASKKSSWAFGSAIACTLIAAIAIFCAAMAAYPRVRGPAKSMLFFGKVAKMGAADYSHLFAAMTDAQFLDDLTEQIHRNAEIACEKHGWVGKAMMFSFLSAIPWLIAVAQLVIL